MTVSVIIAACDSRQPSYYWKLKNYVISVTLSAFAAAAGRVRERHVGEVLVVALIYIGDPMVQSVRWFHKLLNELDHCFSCSQCVHYIFGRCYACHHLCDWKQTSGHFSQVCCMHVCVLANLLRVRTPNIIPKCKNVVTYDQKFNAYVIFLCE